MPGTGKKKILLTFLVILPIDLYMKDCNVFDFDLRFINLCGHLDVINETKLF